MNGRESLTIERAGAAEAQAEPSHGAPPLVREVLQTPGRALDDATRAYMEPRFGHDFGKVRVHADERAAESAQMVGANAYTVGDRIVFGAGQYSPSTAAGRGLVAHELTHVVQQTRAGHTVQFERLGVSRPEDAAEREAAVVSERVTRGESVRIAAAAGPVLHRDIQKTFPAQFGRYEFDLISPKGISGKENVIIRFDPDPNGPKTQGQTIKFKQIARVTFLKSTPLGDQPNPDMNWTKAKPEDAQLDNYRTTRASKTHVTTAGDTLSSLGLLYFGRTDAGYKIYNTNDKELALPAPPLLTDPLPAGKTLTIQDAVEGGFALDIDPTQFQPRASATTPNVSPAYPHVFKVGGNPDGGTPTKAVMEDQPGLSFDRARFDFESAAYAEDLGITYGSVHWGFRGSGVGVAAEWAEFAPGVSQTFRQAEIEFNKFFKNKHKVQAGDTLKKVSTMYFGAPDKAGDIYQANSTLLTNPDTNAPLPPGVELTLPGVSAATAATAPKAQ